MNFFISWTWQNLGEALFNPKAEGIDSKIKAVKQRLPVPVFWLLGKTQSGKTSIIRALTGNDAAEIGNGFQPCTRHSNFYDFPSASHPIIRFLDTRGLGESTYNPTEDLTWCAHQAHLLIVVMRALDMNQAQVVDAVKTVHAQHPKWPIIVAQTALHEAYPAGTDHTLPYPYAQAPIPPQAPYALTQALLYQRDWFKGMPVHFIPLDFTLPEDGFQPVNYGLEALWDGIEAALPKTLIGLLRDSGTHQDLWDFHARKSHPHLIGYALVNIGMGALPIAGLPLVIAVQAKLFHSIASIYGLALTRRLYGEFSALLGSGVGMGLLGRELLKLIPVYGWAVSGVYSGAVTYALGRAFCLYLNGVKRGALPSHEALLQAYENAFADARHLLKNRGA